MGRLSTFLDEVKPILSAGRSAEGKAATSEARAMIRKDAAAWATKHKKGLMVGAGVAGAYGLFNVSPFNREARYRTGRMPGTGMSSGAAGAVPARSSGGYTYGGY